MIRPELKDTLKSAVRSQGPLGRGGRARRHPGLRADQGPGSGRAHACRRRSQIHPVRPDGDRAHHRRGRCRADDLAAAGLRSRPRASASNGSMPTTSIKVQPVLISVWWTNTDWARSNEDAAKRFVRGTLRGVRDYCNAYHRGPNRDEVTQILAKYSDVKDAAPDRPDRMGRRPIRTAASLEASIAGHPGRRSSRRSWSTRQGAGRPDRAG